MISEKSIACIIGTNMYVYDWPFQENHKRKTENTENEQQYRRKRNGAKNSKG